MFEKSSLTNRIAIGKIIGLIVGVIAFFSVPIIMPELSMRFRFGMVFWYMTMGAVIGVFGVYTKHPVLHVPLPWWLRGIGIGCWMNFVLTMFAYEELSNYMDAYFGSNSFLSYPYWMVAEGGAVGLFMAFVATRLGGEGPDTLDDA